ncbi:CoA-acylating methylmalonate-semialdehyde dehydrogenase [Sulfobacillus acidophilus]|uniref:methylmalonate-semialdehyde dehydrogenase (CoA acylating) n=1 Tax=Sulfobacillus acidophilus TaxID=53633 RepID=A0ABS3AYT2_9FIRM|nr:CoA-acylating methylmalonate-semialdehyde dehydrogenase [Sulfobacillus acidophilus]
MKLLKNFVNGNWVSSLGPLPLRSQLNQASASAKNAFDLWRQVPVSERVRYLIKFCQLLNENRDELASICSQEHGKSKIESQGEIGRGIESVEHALGMPSMMMGSSLSQVAHGIDSMSIRQPVGVFAAITPFNFPCMIPLWFLPYAISSGNTFILKPSEQTPKTAEFIFSLLEKCSLPKGVVNLVHGSKEVVDAILEDENIVGVSFVGSSKVAKYIYEKGSQYSKRVQALGGAKNFMVVKSDANLELSLKSLCDSAFGCSGQRCLAGANIIAVGSCYEKLRAGLVTMAKSICCGPVISAAHKDRVLSYIAQGIAEGATLLLDGREENDEYENKSNHIGPTIFDDVLPCMSIAKEEIFGPVLCLMRAKNLNEAIEMINESPYANAATLYTSSGKNAALFTQLAQPSMLGINVGVPAPMAFFPFGGCKNSLFGSLKAGGEDAVRFYTDTKVVTSRWF